MVRWIKKMLGRIICTQSLCANCSLWYKILLYDGPSMLGKKEKTNRKLFCAHDNIVILELHYASQDITLKVSKIYDICTQHRALNCPLTLLQHEHKVWVFITHTHEH